MSLREGAGPDGAGADDQDDQHQGGGKGRAGEGHGVRAMGDQHTVAVPCIDQVKDGVVDVVRCDLE